MIHKGGKLRATLSVIIRYALSGLIPGLPARTVKVYICVHSELVGLGFRLGAKRQQVIDLAADRAARLLSERGYKPELSRRFGDWWHRGEIRQMARVHNYFAVEHSDLTQKVADDITEAARLFVNTLYEGQTPERA